MKKQKQRKVTNYDGTIHGNCMRTCIAAMLDLDQDELPFWEDMGAEWHQSFHETLDKYGLECHGIETVYMYQKDYGQVNGFLMFLEAIKSYIGVDGYVCVSGTSWREYVTRGHMVIYKDGELFLDPHPDNNGLKTATEYWFIERKK
jgi:hypothetical protein